MDEPSVGLRPSDYIIKKLIDLQRDILPLKNILYRLALRITLNSQEAEDVVQDVIIKIWGMGERINAIENIESFALRLTRNLSIDRQRMKINQTASYDEVKVEQGYGIHNTIERQVVLHSVCRILTELVLSTSYSVVSLASTRLLHLLRLLRRTASS